ncbi:hypothetical protein [uncultured Bacteroides sp.]|uniref:hypothetical protein n=1 Tax=uncultured Bacteroides sp. TaxID=162156 RepID=UPI00261725B0|nr:hypothetical protein [uncultured Bacteroides sp.]
MKKNFLRWPWITCCLCALLNTNCGDDDNETPPTYIPEPQASVTVLRTGTIESTQLTVGFQPSENTIKWAYAIGEPNQEEEFRNDQLEGIKQVEGNQLKEVIFENLNPETIYTVYAKAYNSEGVAGGISTLKFPTGENFTPSQQYVLSQSAGFTMEFNANIYRCRYYLGKAADREKFIADQLDNDQELIERTAYTANFFNLEPNTDYVFYSMVYNRGNQPNAFSEIPFTTPNTDGSPIAFMTPNEKNDTYRSIFTISCENASKMIVLLCPKGSFDTLLYEDLHKRGNLIDGLEVLASTNGAQVSEDGKPMTLAVKNGTLKPGSKFDLYVLLYDYANEPAGVQYIEASCPTFIEDLPAAAVEMEVTDITTNGATYKVTPNQYTMGYLINTFEADYYEGLVANNTPEKVAQIVQERLLELGEYFYYYADSYPPYTETKGTPGTKYYAIACPMNVNGAEGFGSITVQEFTTLNESGQDNIQ